MITPSALLTLAGVLTVVALTWLHHARVQAGRLPQRRPLPALDLLRAALGRGAETGRAVHVSPGASLMGAGEGGRASTAELIAGLTVAERVAAEAAANGAPILVSSGDAVAHLALRGGVRRAYRTAGQPQDYDPRRIQLLAQSDDLAYAAGVASLYGREPLEASLMIGSFGQEYLLAGETGAQQRLPQIVGSSSPAALPLMVITTPATLVGEEIFAAEAYLTGAAAPQARLMTHDALRLAAIGLLLLGFLYGVLQPRLGLPPLPGW